MLARGRDAGAHGQERLCAGQRAPAAVRVRWDAVPLLRDGRLPSLLFPTGRARWPGIRVSQRPVPSGASFLVPLDAPAQEIEALVDVGDPVFLPTGASLSGRAPPRLPRAVPLRGLGCLPPLPRGESAGGSHPPPLAEPCVNLSAYTAPIVQPPGFKPMRQWANNCGDRREASASSSRARCSRRRSRLYLRMAQRTRRSLMRRRRGYNTIVAGLLLPRMQGALQSFAVVGEWGGVMLPA